MPICLNEQLQKELFELIHSLSFKRGHFVLASGKTSDYYIDCRMTTLSARGAYLTGALLYEEILPLQVDAVGGIGHLMDLRNRPSDVVGWHDVDPPVGMQRQHRHARQGGEGAQHVELGRLGKARIAQHHGRTKHADRHVRQ